MFEVDFINEIFNMKCKFEGCFSVGERIRAYDYNPSLMEGKEVFLEGEIIDVVDHPIKAYKVLCDKCTFLNREGKEIIVPMEIASFEFDGRIVKA